MSSLLRVLGITDAATYKAWCRDNHPDKKPNDPDATRVFQEVQADYRKHISGEGGGAAAASKTAPKPHTHSTPKVPVFVSFPKDGCGVHVSGTTGNVCHLKKLPGHSRCFYHLPGTNNIRFLNPDEEEADVCEMLSFFRKKPRTFATCTARTPSGKWCSATSMVGSKRNRCKKHEDYDWKPSVVVEMKTGGSSSPIFVGFLDRKALNRERECNYAHISAKMGTIKDVAETKQLATHVFNRGKLVPIKDFE